MAAYNAVTAAHLDCENIMKQCLSCNLVMLSTANQCCCPASDALSVGVDRRQISVVLTTAMYHGNPRLPDRLNAVSTAAAATAAAVAVSFVQSVQIAWTVIRWCACRPNAQFIRRTCL